MKKNKNIAKLTGYSLLLMAVVAGFSFGFALPKIFETAKLEVVQNNLNSNLPLYKNMLLGNLIILLLDIVVAWSLCLFFKNDNKKLAMYSFALRIIYTVLFGIATYYLAINFIHPSESTSIIIDNYNSFQKIWSIGLIVFGLHLLVVGILMKLHKLIPRILWYLTLIAGASYILIHGIKTISPQSAELTNLLNIILGLPMALGELGLAFWLIVKGAKEK